MEQAFANQTVVITGAAGFIGSHLCDAVLTAGGSVIGVDNFLTGREVNLEEARQNPHFTFIEADVTRPPTEYLPSDRHIDVILHFASPASPPRYQAHPVETYLVNSYATHLLLSFLREHNPQGRLLFASTSEVYGDPVEHPQTEAYWGNVNPNGIRSCYDEAKRMGETVCGVFYRDFGIDTRLVRIFNTYGTRMDPADGRIIPQFMTEALTGRPLTVYGDGSQTRSYCYVDDLVRGILTFASKSGLAGQTINLGNPDEKTVLETALVVKEVASSSSEVEFHELPKDDPTRRRPDITKARELLGWEPQVGLREGLEKCLGYFGSTFG